MITRILVPVDGGSRTALALDVGQRLAGRWAARLDVLALLEEGTNATRRQEKIEQQTAHLRGNANVTIRPVSYSIGADIADEVETEDATLVVMATAARSRGAAVIDSIADDVLRGTASPTLLIGPKADIPTLWPCGPLYVCTDGSDHAERILPHAATVANGLDLEPWVIEVVDAASAAAATPATETNTAGAVAAALGSMTGKVVNYDVLHGSHAAKKIVDYATHHDAGLVALATHGRTGLRRLAMGSVAMSVVHNAECPVLVVRPLD